MSFLHIHHEFSNISKRLSNESAYSRGVCLDSIILVVLAYGVSIHTHINSRHISSSIFFLITVLLLVRFGSADCVNHIEVNMNEPPLLCHHARRRNEHLRGKQKICLEVLNVTSDIFVPVYDDSLVTDRKPSFVVCRQRTYKYYRYIPHRNCR